MDSLDVSAGVQIYVHRELFVDVIEVSLECRKRDVQLFGDLRTRPPFKYEA